MAVAIQAYFDGSGTHDEAEFLTLAGFCGTPAVWTELEASWQDVLATHGLPYLHMRELRQGRGVFADGWTADRRDQLVIDLCGAMNEAHPTRSRDFVGAYRSMNMRDYERLCDELPALRARKEAEAFCVDHVVSVALAALHDPTGNLLREETTVELCFDRNEPFRHKVNRTWQRWAKRGKGIFPLISGIDAADMRETPALQMADFLAWHVNRLLSRGDDDSRPADVVDFVTSSLSLVQPMYGNVMEYEEMRERCASLGLL